MENEVRVNAGLIIIHWTLYATYNNKKCSSKSYYDEADEYRIHYKLLILLLILELMVYIVIHIPADIHILNAGITSFFLISEHLVLL